MSISVPREPAERLIKKTAAGRYGDGVDVCSLIRRGLDFARSWDRAATEESPRIGVVGVVRAFRLGDDGWMAM